MAAVLGGVYLVACGHGTSASHYLDMIHTLAKLFSDNSTDLINTIAYPYGMAYEIFRGGT